MPKRRREGAKKSVEQRSAARICPHSYLRGVLTRLPSMTNRQIKDITPKAWAAANEATVARKAA